MAKLTCAILPGQDITRFLSETLVELDIAVVDYEAMLSIVVEAASTIDPNNFYEPYDCIENHLLGLDVEYDSCTMAEIPLSEVPDLSNHLAKYASMFNKRMVDNGVYDLALTSDGDRPAIWLKEMTPGGDIIITLETEEW